MAIIAVPRPLRDKLGEEAADAPVQVLNQVTEDNRANTLLFVEEKFERRLSEEMSRLNQRITEVIGGVNQRITEEIGGLNLRITEEIGGLNLRITEETSRLEQKISASQANLIKWMFIFWVGQIAVMSGIFFAMLRLSIA